MTIQPHAAGIAYGKTAPSTPTAAGLPGKTSGSLATIADRVAISPEAMDLATPDASYDFTRMTPNR